MGKLPGIFLRLIHLWVICGLCFPKVGTKLSELIPPRSFLVHLYRVDANDPSLSTGQIEALDGSGNKTSFIGMNLLEEFLVAHSLGSQTTEATVSDSADLILSSSGPSAGS